MSPRSHSTDRRSYDTSSYTDYGTQRDPPRFSGEELNCIKYLHFIQGRKYDRVAASMLRFRVLKVLDNLYHYPQAQLPQILAMLDIDVEGECVATENNRDGTRNLLPIPGGWHDDTLDDIEQFIGQGQEALEKYMDLRLKEAVNHEDTRLSTKAKVLRREYNELRAAAKFDEDLMYRRLSQLPRGPRTRHTQGSSRLATHSASSYHTSLPPPTREMTQTYSHHPRPYANEASLVRLPPRHPSS
ncbi:MAG: hypothetical protein Q9218_002557 [Villophora microphyllina]